MPSMNDDIAKYPVYMVNKSGELKRIESIQTTDDYNHYAFELHHFIPKSIRKTNLKRYQELEHMQKLILLPKNVHIQIHGCNDKFLYNGLKWFDLLFSRRHYKEGLYDRLHFK